MAAYRILTADGKPAAAIKKGFCWPAFFFGAFWALYRRFWIGAAVLAGVFIVLNVLVNLAERSGSSAAVLITLLLLLGAMFLVGRYGNFLYLAYLDSKGYVVIREVEAESPNDALRSSEKPLKDGLPGL